MFDYINFSFRSIMDFFTIVQFCIEQEYMINWFCNRGGCKNKALIILKCQGHLLVKYIKIDFRMWGNKL